MLLIAPQAKYFAYELTRERPAGDDGRLIASLQDAQVDLNPHQVDAALFAFKSPLSKGAILADEVGLGKTIEAGIILSQKWAERKRRLLVLCPANLRKQWNQELLDKFHLPSVIMESKSFNETIQSGNFNPFKRSDEIVICSYQFVRSKEIYVRKVEWDLVIVDEAHRLRNVYKPNSKIANAIKNAIYDAPKVLLTATPLQNSILELYGLVSIVDDFAFGDIKSFKAQFGRVSQESTFEELKQRLQPICKRTLRRQVLEYINYTNRIPLVEEFYPYLEERQLYTAVSEYLRKPSLYALPASQRHLITLILRKLLSSSSFAISGTLQTMIQRLKDLLAKQSSLEDTLIADLSANYDDFEDAKEEWIDDEDEGGETVKVEETPLSDAQIDEVQQEIKELEGYFQLATSIEKNSKGEKLMTALTKGFEKLSELVANKKAIIFTESTRTQTYIKNLLEANGYAGQIVLFNGSNSDAESNAIYQDWLQRHKGTDRITGSPTADKRQAIVDLFRDKATIMVATEAAAEGINLQFCSLVVNYDLPWNPQRIEQRIGRCHRYGQKFDVVVLNFLNLDNAADQRVYQLLDEKFQLFSGVFGASDEVLGSIQSGMDFEKRIAMIYQECRKEEDIKQVFDQLQQELETEITENLQETKRKLLENFDEEVQSRLKLRLETDREQLGKYESMLWALTKFGLQDVAVFDDTSSAFQLTTNPFADAAIHSGPYYLLRSLEGNRKTESELPDDANVYRVGHTLAQRVIAQCKQIETPVAPYVFDLTGSRRKLSALESHIGQSGWLMVSSFFMSSLDREEYLVAACVTQDGVVLSQEDAFKLLNLPATSAGFTIPEAVPQELLQSLALEERNRLLEQSEIRNAQYFSDEMEKLDKWAEDMKLSLEREIKDLEAMIKLKKAEARRAMRLELTVSLQREVKELEAQKNQKRRHLYEAQDEIEAKKDSLLDKIQLRLQRTSQHTPLFTIYWQVV